jgi:hypothetical protein
MQTTTRGLVKVFHIGIQASIWDVLQNPITAICKLSFIVTKYA